MKRFLVPGLTVGLFIGLILLTFVVMYYQARTEKGVLIAQDIKRLTAIFERIDEQCTILSFDNVLNPINFLTIKKDGFVGSEVGSMNIAYPEKWQGPYAQDNPAVQGREYQIVVTKRGYFITPGNGVELPNGKTIGKDIILTRESDISALMASDDGFAYKNGYLAAPIAIKSATSIPAATPEWAQELV